MDASIIDFLDYSSLHKFSKCADVGQFPCIADVKSSTSSNYGPLPTLVSHMYTNFFNVATIFVEALRCKQPHSAVLCFLKWQHVPHSSDAATVFLKTLIFLTNNWEWGNSFLTIHSGNFKCAQVFEMC